MKVLTLWQPWASLCVIINPVTGQPYKTIETRSWSTKYRGPLAIHAAAKMPTFERRYVKGVICIRDAWDLWTISGPNVYAPLPLGAIVGTCTLVDVVPILAGEPRADDQRSPNRMFSADRNGVLRDWQRSTLGGYPGWVGSGDCDNQRPYGDFTPGRYAWLLADVVPVDPPVPFKGGQGFTKTWEPHVEAVH